MSPDNLEPRVAALEAQVNRLTERVRSSEQDAAAARVLAGAADRDVDAVSGELRAFRRAATAGFNAVREDLTDLRRHMDERFARIDDQFDAVDNGFIGVRAKLDIAAAGQQRIVELLEHLIADGDDATPGSSTD